MATITLDYFRPPITLSELLQKFGFTEIIPPSTFYGPGTFNTVEKRNDGSVVLHPTCELDRNAISTWWRESATVDRELRERLVQKFSLSNSSLKKLSSQGDTNRIREAYLSLHNAKLLLASDEALLKLQEQYIKGGCEAAIIHNIKHGGCVYQTEAVLQADYQYSIDYDNANNGVLDTITEGANLFVENSSSSDGMNNTSGKSLFFGARLPSRCLTLEDTPKATHVAHNSSSS